MRFTATGIIASVPDESLTLLVNNPLGSDAGSESAATLNGVNPETYLRRAFTVIADHLVD